MSWKIKRNYFIKQVLSEITKLPENSIAISYENPIHPQNYHYIYGAFIEYKHFKSNIIDSFSISKGMLHPSVTSSPNFQKTSEIIKEYTKVTLPGFTCFNIEDLILALEKLHKDYGFKNIRLKPVFEASGRGQKAISLTNLSKLKHSLNTQPSKLNFPLVCEPNLNVTNVFSITLTTVPINKELKTYTSINKILEYRTNDIFIYAGSISYKADFWFSQFSTKERTQFLKILNTVRRIKQLYLKEIGIFITRFNIDILIGYNEFGQKEMVVVDPSIRVGGASPAELLNILFPGIHEISALYCSPTIAKEKDLMKSDNHLLQVYDDAKKPLYIALPKKYHKIVSKFFTKLHNNYNYYFSI